MNNYSLEILNSVAAAERLASENGINIIHLCLGLMLADTRAGEVLKKLGIRAEEALLTLDSYADATGISHMDGTCQDMLIKAGYVAEEYECTEIQSYHLLLAMLRAENPRLKSFLSRFSVDEQEAEAAALSMSKHCLGTVKQSRIAIRQTLQNEELHKKIMLVVQQMNT